MKRYDHITIALGDIRKCNIVRPKNMQLLSLRTLSERKINVLWKKLFFTAYKYNANQILDIKA